MKIPLIYHADYAGYDFGANHPFRGDRFRRFMEEFEERFPQIYESLDIIEPSPAEFETLLKVHTHQYVERVKMLEKRRGYLSIDTQILPGSIDAARLLVGGTIEVTLKALETGLALGFGGLHHAGPDYGEGFCIFNDVAISSTVLLERGLEKIMIIDTDAHQGNGTMDIFYPDPHVLFVSLHQDPLTLYPGRGFVDEIGTGEGAGFTVNIPMPTLSTGEMYMQAMNSVVFPLLEEFKPEIVIRNGGSDPLYTDTLTNLGLDMESLSSLTAGISVKTRELGIPLADLFLSGYGPYVTEGWFAIVRGTLGVEMKLNEPEEPLMIGDAKMKNMWSILETTLDRLRSNLKPFWKIF